MNKSTQYNQQTEPKKCKPDVEEICIYQNLKCGHQHHSIYSYMSLKINSGFHARKNPKQQCTKNSCIRLSDCSFCKKCPYVYSHGVCRSYTEQTISSAWESFNIRQKLELGLFALGVTHILNLPTQFASNAQSRSLHGHFLFWMAFTANGASWALTSADSILKVAFYSAFTDVFQKLYSPCRCKVSLA